MKCRCRQCQKIYNSHSAKSNYRGYCTAKCEHAKAKSYGWSKAKEKKGGRSEYETLKQNNAVGDVPIAIEAVFALLQVSPRNGQKAWFWHIGEKTLNKYHERLKAIPDVEVEFRREQEGQNPISVHKIEEADSAIVRIRK